MAQDVIPLQEVSAFRRLEAHGKVRVHTTAPEAHSAKVEEALVASVRVRLEVDTEDLLRRLVEAGVPMRMAVRIAEKVSLDDQVYLRP
jgi:hypothetical protein